MIHGRHISHAPNSIRALGAAGVSQGAHGRGGGMGGSTTVTHCNNTKLIAAIFRSETRSHNMSHAKASAHCRAAGDLQFRGHALHGLRIVSIKHTHIETERERERGVSMPPSLAVSTIVFRPLKYFLLLAAWKAPICALRLCDAPLQVLSTARQWPGKHGNNTNKAIRPIANYDGTNYLMFNLLHKLLKNSRNMQAMKYVKQCKLNL